MHIYSRYDPPPQPRLIFTEPTRTKQAFANEVDINQIVARAINTGDTTVLSTTQRAEYYDASSYGDYTQALEMIQQIDDDFYSLPSDKREHFGNNPDAYVAFLSDPRNAPQAVKLGLLEGGEKPKPKVSDSGPSKPAVAPSETSGAPKVDADNRGGTVPS